MVAVVALVVVAAGVTKTYTRTGKPLVAVFAVVARVTQIHKLTGRPLVTVVARVTERHTGAGRPFGFSGRKSHLETYTFRDKLEDRRLQGLL